MGGAPIGNKNASKGNRLFADTLRRVLLADDSTKLRSLAEKLVDRALEGDVSALKEVADRMDGKSKQQTEISGPDGEAIPHSLTVEFVNAQA